MAGDLLLACPLKKLKIYNNHIFLAPPRKLRKKFALIFCDD